MLGAHAGHTVDFQRIDPQNWNEAAILDFMTGEDTAMRAVIAKAVGGPGKEADRAPPNPYARDWGDDSGRSR